jgi:hypothetical protein
MDGETGPPLDPSLKMMDVIQNKLPVTRSMKRLERPPPSGVSLTEGSDQSADEFARPLPLAGLVMNATPSTAPVQKLTVGPDGKILYLDDPGRKQEMVRQSNKQTSVVKVKERAGTGRAKAVSDKRVHGRWSRYETDKFYDALRLFGTDFTLMTTRFSNRTRKQLKAKFTKEEGRNSSAITDAVKDPFPLPDDCDPFEIRLPCQNLG